MTVLIVPRGTSLDDANSHCCVASSLELALDIYDRYYPVMDGAEFDVYLVGGAPVQTVKAKRAPKFITETVSLL